MDEQKTAYSWIDRARGRIITIGAIYLLGVVATIVMQLQNGFDFVSGFPVIFLILFFLPTGFINGVVLFFPYVRILFGGGRLDERLGWLGFLPFIVLIVVIMRARSRVVLVLGYIGFILFILLAVRGCSQPIRF
jgi:hypothetical protein